MEEIIKAVAAKTGLSHDIAKIAVATVITHLKGHLPKMLADQIDGFLGTAHTGDSQHAAGDQAQGGGVMGSVMKGLGGILGKK